MTIDRIKIFDKQYKKDEKNKNILVLKIDKKDLGKFLESLGKNKNKRMMLHSCSQSFFSYDNKNEWYKFKNYRNNEKELNEIELIFSKSKWPEKEDKYKWTFKEIEWGEKVNELRLIENEKEYMEMFGKEKNDVNSIDIVNIWNDVGNNIDNKKNKKEKER